MFEIAGTLDSSVDSNLQIPSENLLHILHALRGVRTKIHTYIYMYIKKALELCC